LLTKCDANYTIRPTRNPRGGTSLCEPSPPHIWSMKRRLKAAAGPRPAKLPLVETQIQQDFANAQGSIRERLEAVRIDTWRADFNAQYQAALDALMVAPESARPQHAGKLEQLVASFTKHATVPACQRTRHSRVFS
jgi:hypothetical protein